MWNTVSYSKRFAFSTFCFIFISASFEGIKFWFKFAAEFTLSFWHMPGQKYKIVYLSFYIQKTDTSLSEAAGAHKGPSIYKTKLPVYGHKQSDFLASFSLLRWESINHAYCYKS